MEKFNFICDENLVIKASVVFEIFRMHFMPGNGSRDNLVDWPGRVVYVLQWSKLHEDGLYG